MAIFVESEIWPNMIKNLYLKKIPIILLNARITKKSFNRWKIFPRFAKSIFGKISLAMPQNIETSKYLKLLGVKKIKISGNLKYFGHKKDNKINKKLKNKFVGKEVWCAASTHSDEEIFIGKLHKKIKTFKKNFITILIPRHINRSEVIINDLKTLGLKIVKHSSSEKIRKDTDIYLVDTYGETSKFYKLSKVTFLGGSLNSSIHHGGQNPLEPARLGNYILHGPKINNFKEVYSMLKNNRNSCKINRITDMEKKLIEKMKYKQSSKINRKLILIGKKILIRNLAEINNFI
jgi:3-deoxy-D-manno-octulosonic-acid transferase